jgi:hypothetical protein
MDPLHQANEGNKECSHADGLLPNRAEIGGFILVSSWEVVSILPPRPSRAKADVDSVDEGNHCELKIRQKMLNRNILRKYRINLSNYIDIM